NSAGFFGFSGKPSTWSKNPASVGSSSLPGLPTRYCVELPCGSRSTTRTCAPPAALTAARLQAIVALPTPPLRLNTTRRMALLLFLPASLGCSYVTCWSHHNPRCGRTAKSTSPSVVDDIPYLVADGDNPLDIGLRGVPAI